MKDTMSMNESDFEPESHESVLKNRLGITTKDSINEAETIALKAVADELLGLYDAGHKFTASDIQFMHRAWLGSIYSWAGEYRKVDMGREGISLAPARQIPRLMKAFEEGALRRNTPCNFKSADRVTKAMAEVYIELFLIHPFLRGNARSARLLVTIMAAQAGLPLLDFKGIAGDKAARYRGAIDRGLHGDFGQMEELFGLILQRSMKTRVSR